MLRKDSSFLVARFSGFIDSWFMCVQYQTLGLVTVIVRDCYFLQLTNLNAQADFSFGPSGGWFIAQLPFFGKLVTMIVY